MRPTPFRLLVPLTAALAGLLFAASAATAHGTDLRAGRLRQLSDLVAAQRTRLAKEEAQAAKLRAEVDRAAARAAPRPLSAAAAATAAAAGLTPVTGPGVRVVLHDAPQRVPSLSNNPDDLVVHQQDLEAVVNGLWAGGAQAMTLMGQRVVSTSAVRCVGNTVILHGVVYGPPFVVAAVGQPAALLAGLDREPGVAYFRSFVRRFQLGYAISVEHRLALPGYAGSVDLPHVAA